MTGRQDPSSRVSGKTQSIIDKKFKVFIIKLNIQIQIKIYFEMNIVVDSHSGNGPNNQVRKTNRGYGIMEF